MVVVRWSGLVEREPELAGFGEQRLRAAPAYIATVREDGMPRVHPVTPIFAEGGAYCSWSPHHRRAAISANAAGSRCTTASPTAMGPAVSSGSRAGVCRS